ncbi:hypothetical protein EJ110_NYTH49426 [Nymphaea thermarum]|nr:hypothetical protein EJ110_NYTH49426 [Nymphaea thermarum]
MGPKGRAGHDAAKLEHYNSYLRRINTTKLIAASSNLLFHASLLIALLLVLFISLSLTATGCSPTDALHHHRLLSHRRNPSPQTPPSPRPTTTTTSSLTDAHHHHQLLPHRCPPPPLPFSSVA